MNKIQDLRIFVRSKFTGNRTLPYASYKMILRSLTANAFDTVSRFDCDNRRGSLMLQSKTIKLNMFVALEHFMSLKSFEISPTQTRPYFHERKVEHSCTYNADILNEMIEHIRSSIQVLQNEHHEDSKGDSVSKELTDLVHKMRIVHDWIHQMMQDTVHASPSTVSPWISSIVLHLDDMIRPYLSISTQEQFCINSIKGLFVLSSVPILPYNEILGTLSKFHSIEAAVLAQSILDQLIALYKLEHQLVLFAQKLDPRNTSLPSISNYFVPLSSHSTRSSKLTTFSFNATLSCWKKTLLPVSPNSVSLPSSSLVTRSDSFLDKNRSKDSMRSLDQIDSVDRFTPEYEQNQWHDESFAVKQDKKVISIFESMMHLYNTTPSRLTLSSSSYSLQPIAPNNITFRTILSTILLVASRQKEERIRTKRGKKGRVQIDSLPTNDGICSSPIKDSNGIEYYHESKRILDVMIRLYQDFSSSSMKNVTTDGAEFAEIESSFKPTKDLFHMVLSTLQHCDDDSTAERCAFELFHLMKSLASELKDPELRPDLLMYKSVVGILLRSNSTHRRKKGFHDKITIVKDLVLEMEQRFLSQNNESDSIQEDVSTIRHFLLYVYANAGYAEEAYGVLQKILAEYVEGHVSHLTPATTMWNSVLGAFANAGLVDRSMDILNEMQELDKMGHNFARPDKVSISIILKALARQNSKVSGEKALQLLDQMDRMVENGNVSMKPDLITYSTVIGCLLKARRTEEVTKAENILLKIGEDYIQGYNDVRPDCILYKHVVSSLIQVCPDGVERADGLLSLMEAGNVARHNYASLDDVLDCYSSTIFGYCTKSSSSDAVYRAENVLARMETVVQKETGSASFPRTIHYNWILDALAKKSDMNASKLAMDLLTRMETRFKSGISTVQPDSYSYAAVMMAIANGWDRSTRAKEAQKLLDHVISSVTTSHKINQLQVQVNRIIFNNAIRAIEKSGEGNKAAQVQQVLEKMIQLGNSSHHGDVQPDIVTYNGIIRACAYTYVDKMSAFNLAMTSLNEIRGNKGVTADNYTYPAMFLACDRLLGRGNNDLTTIKTIFDMCCEDGFVSDLVVSHLNQMRTTLPSDFISKLLRSGQSDGVTPVRFPESWTRKSRCQGKSTVTRKFQQKK